MKNLRKRNPPLLEKNPPSPLCWFAGQHRGCVCFPRVAWRSPPSWQNSVTGPTKGKGCCCRRLTSRDFQLIFWRTGLSFLTSVNYTHLFSEYFLWKNLCWPFSYWKRAHNPEMGTQMRWNSYRLDWLQQSFAWTLLLATWRIPKNQALRVQASVPRQLQLTLWTQLWEIFTLSFCALPGRPGLVPFKHFASKTTEESVEAACVQMNRKSWQCSPRLALSHSHCKILRLHIFPHKARTTENLCSKFSASSPLEFKTKCHVLLKLTITKAKF